jgi:hypothetical protein
MFASLLICVDRPAAGCPELNSENLYALIDAEYKASCPYISKGPVEAQDSLGKPHCCYNVEVDACVGRPLRIAGQIQQAPLARGVVWG